MKKILKNRYIIILISLCVILTNGCGKWFDVSSSVDLKEDEMYSSENGFFDVLIGGYSKMAAKNLYGDRLTLSCLDIMSYSYKLENQAPKAFLALSRFEYNNSDVEPIIKQIWGEMYKVIADNNKLLERLESADRKMFTGDNYNMIKGEALALRAYLHFDLVRMFGPSAVVDKNKKCIPYRTTFGKDNVPYSSLNEVAEKALADLKEAETLLSNDIVLRPMERPTSVYLMNRTLRLNLFAVRALIARIELYRGTKKEDVYKVANDLLTQLNTNINYPHFSNVPTDVVNDKIFSFELLFGLYVDKLKDYASSYFSVTTGGANELRNSSENLNALFNVKNPAYIEDVRYDLLFDREDQSVPRLRKFRQETTDSPRSSYRMPLIKLSEVCYIAAETAPDVATAQTHINRVLAARRLVSKTFDTMEDVNQFLEEEYRRDFIAEGQLFYFYKRKNYSNIPNCQEDIASKLSEIYLFPLPQQEIDWGSK